MRKKVIILDHNENGRLANQLWPFISIYAYCLEKDFSLDNYCFFQYAEFFNIPLGNKLVKLIFFDTYRLVKFFWPRKKHKRLLYFFQRAYRIYADHVRKTRPNNIIATPDIPYVPPTVHYLEPTKNSDKALDSFEKDANKEIYLDGWLFRNPAGLKKFRAQIISYFKPQEKYLADNERLVKELRNKYEHIVGVHVRQGDYKKKFVDGQYYFNEREVSAHLKSYLEQAGIKNDRTCFILCSDEGLDLGQFSGLNVVRSHGNAVEDLFLLSKTDLIIGSNSSYGAFASYYGNIPMIIFQRESIDWEYYKDKKEYFEDKYCTFVWY